jgi:hypothetical protein
MQNGKGDRNRISNFKSFSENWDLIFSKKRKPDNDASGNKIEVPREIPSNSVEEVVSEE